MAKDYLEQHMKFIQQYLAGERKSDRICTTKAIAKILQHKLDVLLIANEPINEKLGLYMFKIIKKTK